MPAFYYHDAYLRVLVTDEIEVRATADVDTIQVFPAEWRERLAVLRAYVIVCLENTKSNEDTFSAKETKYRKEFDFVLARAKVAASASSPSAVPSIFSVPISRG